MSMNWTHNTVFCNDGTHASNDMLRGTLRERETEKAGVMGQYIASELFSRCWNSNHWATVMFEQCEEPVSHFCNIELKSIPTLCCKTDSISDLIARRRKKNVDLLANKFKFRLHLIYIFSSHISHNQMSWMSPLSLSFSETLTYYSIKKQNFYLDGN